MAKLPTRSPTHADVEVGRLAGMGLELEEIAEYDQSLSRSSGRESETPDNGVVTLPALVELAEDRGRPASHYIAALVLATELQLAPRGPLVVKICAGNCQRWGALDLLDHLVGKSVTIAPSSCLDRCDQAPACELHGVHGQLVLAPATTASLDEAIDTLR